MKTLVLTGGGTAGHVTPHLALLNQLKKHFTKISYIGSNAVEKEIITKKTDLPFYQISSVKFVRKSLFKNLFLPFKLLKAKKEALQILKELKPDVIFSKGGYVSVPVVLAAKTLKIPVVCHESDLSLGLANKIGAKYAKTVCTTFKKTAELLPNKGVFSGSPINEQGFKINKAQFKDSLKINSNLPILLVTGGSLGSVAINTSVINSINELTKKFFVIHVTGKGNTKNFETKPKNYLQIEYADNLPALISISDVVISRAGSNTIFELAYAKKPMLLIPLPKGTSRGDQVENANYFKTEKIASVLLQENLTPENLVKSVNLTFTNRQKLIANLNNFNFKNGTQTIIYEILKACKNKN